ncbi:hypothetical protein P691DRAFT_777785 [Macrolepiota fuliginosa MF-IS2]|uniref:Nephrocystin 3-like N-terminal domain-containing protein n=1 Tax=Macrolepiota fuliginosa MF-IS2 TaxID=1400762 RepID=A0A9P5X608_9AGAR|nr:hypothetical protein P691DRAFT_777785 [Macrolepiota fuliginosa MF-IS2]
MFNGAHNFVANGPFIEQVNTHAPSGIDLLRKSSVPEATRDSSARDPPRCFPGTREEHIRNITGWAIGNWQDRQARLLWLYGPAGVGKSALAQTCAEKLEDKIGASFFFSRLDGKNDPDKFFTTLVCQLVTKNPHYYTLIDNKVRRDPNIVSTSITTQFKELIVLPLRELEARGHNFTDDVIVIDGLDECEGEDAQRSIIEVIATSIAQKTMPFLWAFFSRPEPHITTALHLDHIKDISWHLTLPVSRDADRDIEAYLRDGFRMIHARYTLPSTVAWPSDSDLQQLVEQSAGLFIYAATVIRFIADGGALGPEEQLWAVLALTRVTHTASNPFSRLDLFYLLIVQQIPEAILPNALSLLFTYIQLPYWQKQGKALISSAILGFSSITFYAAVNKLHSVLDIERSPNGMPLSLSFYHASFSDFLRDPTRSTLQFCVDTPYHYGRLFRACAQTLCRLSDVIRGMRFILNHVSEQADPQPDGSSFNKIVPWQDDRGSDYHDIYICRSSLSAFLVIIPVHDSRCRNIGAPFVHQLVHLPRGKCEGRASRNIYPLRT